MKCAIQINLPCLALPYYKQKMASEKSAKTPAVLDFNTQHHELALEGTQRQDSAKPPHREWDGPPSNRERDSHAGTRPKQRYDCWDGPRGRQRSPGRHGDKSWDQARPHENQWEREEDYGQKHSNTRLGKAQLAHRVRCTRREPRLMDSNTEPSSPSRPPAPE